MQVKIFKSNDPVELEKEINAFFKESGVITDMHILDVNGRLWVIYKYEDDAEGEKVVKL